MKGITSSLIPNIAPPSEKSVINELWIAFDEPERIGIYNFPAFKNMP